MDELFGGMLVCSLAGVFAGTITGITPGLHVNLASTLVLSIVPALPFSPVLVAFFVLAMAITHTFVDAIPTVFLGVPDMDKPVAVLPCHKLVLEGQGCEAVRLLTLGAFLCSILGILLLPLFVWMFPLLYKFLKPVLGWILLGMLCFLVLRENGLNKKLFAAIVVVLSGLLGLLTFSVLHREPLIPLLSGLFGVSSLLLNFSNSFPVQRELDHIRLSWSEMAVVAVSGTLSGGFIALLPALGPAQAGVLASLAMSGGINTANFVVSLATMASMNKARNGALEVVLQLSPVDSALLWKYAAVTLLVAGIAVVLTLRLAPLCARLLSRVSLQLVSMSVICFVVLLVVLLSGSVGFLVLFTGACIGILAQVFDVNRSHCMDCLLVPVILYFI